jgi:transposase
MADWLPEEHLVWFVLEVVTQLDTAAFHAARKTGGVGRQGYDPDMLLALMIYAYSVGQRSSRRIEQLCVDHVAFRVLCGQDAPDHTTIARFRSAYHDAFADLFAQVLRLCADAGMIKVGVISIDGTKIAANGSISANRSHEWLAEQARRIASDVVADADATDAAEDATEADEGRAGGLPAQFAPGKGRVANIKKALEELARQDEADAKETAVDRERIEEYLAKVQAGEPGLRRAPAGTDPIHLNEIRIQREQQRIASVEGVRGATASAVRHEAKRSLKKYQQALADARQQVASGQFDERTRSVRLRDERRARARARGSRGPAVNVTDPESRLMTEGSGGGSVQGYNAQVAVSDDHLVIGVHLSQDANDFNCWKPTLTAAQSQLTLLGKTIGLALADTGYFTEENVTAGGPDKLIAPGKSQEVIRDATSNPADGPPPEDLEPLDAMRHRMRQPENAKRYKRRSATVEPVIGHLKDQTGLRRFSRRGLAAAAAELNFAAAVLNLTKLHTHTSAIA